MVLKPIIEFRLQAWATRFIFFMGIANGVVFAIGFQGAITYPLAIFVQRREAADIHHPQIQRRFTFHHPVSQYPACPTTCRNSECIKTCPDKHVGAFWCGTHNEVAIGRKTFSAIDHRFHPNLGEGRNAFDGLRHVLFEVFKIIIKQSELPVIWQILGGPGNGIGLIAPHDQTAYFLLVIGAAIGIAQGRRIW